MRLKTESFGSGDMSWLGSSHGIRNARTVTIDPTAFAAKVKNGVIPSGTPVTITGGTATPYAGTGKFSGFLLTDQPGSGGKIAAPVIDHGRVKVKSLPETFTPPAAADDETTFVYVKEN